MLRIPWDDFGKTDFSLKWVEALDGTEHPDTCRGEALWQSKRRISRTHKTLFSLQSSAPQATNQRATALTRDRETIPSAQRLRGRCAADRLVLTEQPAGVRLEHSRHKNGGLTAKNVGLVRYTPQIEYSFLFACRTIPRLHYRPARKRFSPKSWVLSDLRTRSHPPPLRIMIAIGLCHASSHPRNRVTR